LVDPDEIVALIEGCPNLQNTTLMGERFSLNQH
jgi:hypothetical protein